MGKRRIAMKKIRVYKDNNGRVVATVEQPSSGERAPEPHRRHNLKMEVIEADDNYKEKLQVLYK
jgi:hypothetical protein